MCPILGAGFAPLSGNMPGRKRGEGRCRRPSPGLGARSFNDCACDAACEPLMLDFDARNFDFACLGNCLRHVIGELDGVEERLGFFLMQIEV